MKSEGQVEFHASPWREGVRVILPLALLGAIALALAWWLVEPAQTSGLQALCTVSFEPLFVLYRPKAFGDVPPTRLEQLKGKRVGVGKSTGGTYWVATPMLALHGVGTKDDTATTIVNQSGADSIAKLKEGEIDAGFYAVSADTHYLLDALTTPGIQIASLKLAAGYAHHFEYLTTVQLHEGSLDLGRDVPDHEVSMVAPTTALIARKNVHKAVVQLLEQVVHKVHGRRDPLAPPGAFPTLDYTELPVSADGRYYFSAQPGFLQRMLPFWLASLIDRMLILLVPLAVILIPLVRMAPGIYQWRMRARVYRWYTQLRRLDARLLEPLSDQERAADQARLDVLEREISRTVKVPPSYMASFYTLRMHAEYLREQFAKDPTASAVGAKG